MTSFSPPTGGKAKTPTVVDFRDGWKFAFRGSAIKRALADKLNLLEREIADNLSMLQRELGDDTRTIAALLPTFFEDTRSVKSDQLLSLAKRVADLQKERDELTRVALGFVDEIIYVLSPKDMSELGL